MSPAIPTLTPMTISRLQQIEGKREEREGKGKKEKRGKGKERERHGEKINEACHNRLID